MLQTPALRKKTDVKPTISLYTLKNVKKKELNPNLGGAVIKYRAQKITGKKCRVNKMDKPLVRLTEKERRHK